jgi:hypothetical protein
MPMNQCSFLYKDENPQECEILRLVTTLRGGMRWSC